MLQVYYVQYQANLKNLYSGTVIPWQNNDERQLKLWLAIMQSWNKIF